MEHTETVSPAPVWDLAHVFNGKEEQEAKPAAVVLRHYYRCLDCLLVSVLGEKQKAALTCGTCAGSMEYMGRVEPTFRSSMRLKKDETRCACDERCTSAAGPKCDCPCEGKNHGAGLGATVTVVHDVGLAPKVVMLDGLKKEALLKRVTEWRVASVVLYEQLRAKAKAIRAGRTWLPEDEYYAELTLLEASRKLAGQGVPKTWSARAKALESGGKLV